MNCCDCGRLSLPQPSHSRWSFDANASAATFARAERAAAEVSYPGRLTCCDLESVCSRSTRSECCHCLAALVAVALVSVPFSRACQAHSPATFAIGCRRCFANCIHCHRTFADCVAPPRTEHANGSVTLLRSHRHSRLGNCDAARSNWADFDTDRSYCCTLHPR